ncbi:MULTISPECIES: NAD(+) diphosphatase [Paenibacillus]|uniref:NAD(+) diphosphatase n=1 Tax=Paenibacillus residui TaxID=629724 RepID=A0ABW3DA57_9BACL
MTYKYCPRCGQELSKRIIPDEGEIPYCEACRKPFFMSSQVCVLVAVINEQNHILLTKQKHISNDKWILISGYVKQGHNMEETVVREVKEETGQEVRELQYISSYYHEGSDLLMIGFAAFVTQKTIGSSHEIQEFGWFSAHDAAESIWKGSIAEKLLIKIRERMEI